MATGRIGTSEALATAAEGPSKKRRIAFGVVATLVALFILAQQVFGPMELFLMWLPAETLAEMFEEETSSITLHRAHFMAIGVIAWAVVLSILVQLRKPERRVAPMVLVVAIALGATIVYGLSGTLNEWLIEEITVVVVPVSLVVLLHPSRDRLFSRLTLDRPLAGMVALATAPWLVYIVNNAWTQFTNAAGDTHAEMEHWAIAALMGFVIVVATILGSSDHPGRGLTAAIAVGGSVVYPALEDGRVLEVSNVIWCTGFEPNFDWIDVPVEMRNGLPVQDRGVVESCPGLYFMGLLFQYSLSSALIGGVGRDAEYIVHHIVSTTESRVDDLAGSAR